MGSDTFDTGQWILLKKINKKLTGQLERPVRKRYSATFGTEVTKYLYNIRHHMYVVNIAATKSHVQRENTEENSLSIKRQLQTGKDHFKDFVEEETQVFHENKN